MTQSLADNETPIFRCRYRNESAACTENIWTHVLKICALRVELIGRKKSQRRRQSMTHNSSTVEQFKIKVNCDTFPVNRLHTFRTVHLTIELWKIVFSFLQMNEGLHTQTCREMSFHSHNICMHASEEWSREKICSQSVNGCVLHEILEWNHLLFTKLWNPLWE